MSHLVYPDRALVRFDLQGRFLQWSVLGSPFLERPKIFMQKFVIMCTIESIMPLHWPVSIKRIVKEITHIEGQTRFAIQFSFIL